MSSENTDINTDINEIMDKFPDEDGTYESLKAYVKFINGASLKSNGENTGNGIKKAAYEILKMFDKNAQPNAVPIKSVNEPQTIQVVETKLKLIKKMQDIDKLIDSDKKKNSEEIQKLKTDLDSVMNDLTTANEELAVVDEELAAVNKKATDEAAAAEKALKEKELEAAEEELEKIRKAITNAVKEVEKANKAAEDAKTDKEKKDAAAKVAEAEAELVEKKTAEEKAAKAKEEAELVAKEAAGKELAAKLAAEKKAVELADATAEAAGKELVLDAKLQQILSNIILKIKIAYKNVENNINLLAAETGVLTPLEDAETGEQTELNPLVQPPVLTTEGEEPVLTQEETKVLTPPVLEETKVLTPPVMTDAEKAKAAEDAFNVAADALKKFVDETTINKFLGKNSKDTPAKTETELTDFKNTQENKFKELYDICILSNTAIYDIYKNRIYKLNESKDRETDIKKKAEIDDLIKKYEINQSFSRKKKALEFIKTKFDKIIKDLKLPRKFDDKNSGGGGIDKEAAIEAANEAIQAAKEQISDISSGEVEIPKSQDDASSVILSDEAGLINKLNKSVLLLKAYTTACVKSNISNINNIEVTDENFTEMFFFVFSIDKAAVEAGEEELLGTGAQVLAENAQVLAEKTGTDAAFKALVETPEELLGTENAQVLAEKTKNKTADAAFKALETALTDAKAAADEPFKALDTESKANLAVANAEARLVQAEAAAKAKAEAAKAAAKAVDIAWKQKQSVMEVQGTEKEAKKEAKEAKDALVDAKKVLADAKKATKKVAKEATKKEGALTLEKKTGGAEAAARTNTEQTIGRITVKTWPPVKQGGGGGIDKVIDKANLVAALEKLQSSIMKYIQGIEDEESVEKEEGEEEE